MILSCSNLSLTKPMFLDIPSPRRQELSQQSRDQETQPQSYGFQSEGNIDQKRNTTSGVNMSLDSSTAHNRTARNASPCIAYIVRKFDQCRNSYVSHVHCKRRHFACIQATQKYHYPKCIPVLGFLQATFVGQCDPLPIDCQCAS